MKLILLVLFLVSPVSIALGQISTSGLSDTQRAALEVYAAQLRQETAKNNTPSAKSVEEWVEVGSNIGKGLAGAAKEVGVAVNDFVKTPVGQITAAVILWKFIGSAIVHLIGGLVVLLSGWAFMAYINRRLSPLLVSYDPDKTDVFGRSRRLKIEREKIDSDYAVGSYVWMGVCTIGAMIAIFTYNV